MKLLLDTCVGGGAKEALKEAGHNVVWSGDWDTDPGDEEILSRAHAEGRVLITADKDFGDLAVHQGMPHCGIIRLVDYAGRDHGTVCRLVLDKYRTDIEAHSIITVEPGRVRIRREDSVT